MGILRDVWEIAKQAENAQRSNPGKKALNSIELEQISETGWSVRRIALVKDDHFWELDHEVELVPDDMPKLHWDNNLDSENSVYVSSNRPAVEKDDWLFLIDDDYQIINAQKAHRFLDLE